MEFLRKDAYVVAVAPAVVFLGVYAYELGRYYYLRIPASFIDVSVNRLLAGGALIGTLTAILIGLAAWAWKLADKVGFLGKFFAAVFVSMIYFTLPFALWMSRAPQGAEWKELLSMVTSAGTVAIAIIQWTLTWYWHREERLNSGEPPAAPASGAPHSGLFQSVLVKGVLVGLLLVWTLAVFAGLGFTVERHSSSRQCTEDSFVADVRGDTLVLKKIGRPSGEVSSSTRFVAVEGAELFACSPAVDGSPGLTNLMLVAPPREEKEPRSFRDKLVAPAKALIELLKP
ncbi:hypothetical protein [Stenotrophomonas maltophilia]|uniref:hypothetical protein n=1 Tax=Stenotrophomonas maltophilia TaxID=40324 RepID=UPI001F53AF21|nr:hypothetical protein [Stenotrophomonas maltophilia]MCI1123281.1 hypothetical protein [Stenotrophomonas maltophilia]